MSPKVYRGKATAPYVLMRLSIWNRTPVVFDGFPQKSTETCRGGEGHGTARWSLNQAWRAHTLAGESSAGAAGREVAPLEGKSSFDRGSLGKAESVLEQMELKDTYRASPWIQSLLPFHLIICCVERGQAGGPGWGPGWLPAWALTRPPWVTLGRSLPSLSHL